MSNNIEVRPSAVARIAKRAIQARRPLFIWGPPGIGKSDIVQSISDSGELGNSTVIDLRLALMEPTDIRGYPFRNPETNTMEWSPPVDLPTQEYADQFDTVLLFLDELNSAPPSVQSAAYQLILNRRVGQYTLPDNVVVLAAGNRESDRGVTYRMPAPLANRFRHINMNVNFDDWQEWAINNNIHPDVLGYLTYQKADLFDFDPKTASQAFATPRSWAFVSEILNVDGFHDADESEQRYELAGAIGEGVAGKFAEHRRLSGLLPTPEEIRTGKVTELKEGAENEISAKYSLVVGLCYEFNNMFKENGVDEEFRDQLNNALRFAFKNLQAEMVVLMLKTILGTYKIRVNIRQDLDKDNFEVFRNRYTKYIV